MKFEEYLSKQLPEVTDLPTVSVKKQKHELKTQQRLKTFSNKIRPS